MLLAFVAGLCGLCLIAAPEGVSAERRDSPKRTEEYGTEMAETTKTDSVIPRLFKYADQNVLKEEQYTSDVYVRHRIHTVRRGHIVRYLPHMFRLERGTNDYLTEASLRIQYRPPGEVDCKVKAFHTTGAYLRPMRLENMRRFSFQIYDTRLFTDRILNPLNRRNLRFYGLPIETQIGNATGTHRDYATILQRPTGETWGNRRGLQHGGGQAVPIRAKL